MALVLAVLTILRALRPSRPEHDPALLLGMPANTMPDYEYGTAAETIAEGAVIWRGGDWRRIATHTDFNKPLIIVTDQDGRELQILADHIIVAARLPLRTKPL